MAFVANQCEPNETKDHQMEMNLTLHFFVELHNPFTTQFCFVFGGTLFLEQA